MGGLELDQRLMAREDVPRVTQDTATEYDEIRRRTAISATVVHGAILAEGEAELARHPRALAWSGLAAGLSMGVSVLAQGLLFAGLPDAGWSPLIYRLGYPLGFLAVILGRQQLFTENTLTTVLPFLHDRCWEEAWRLVRLWVVVLAANLIGTGLFAYFLSGVDLVGPGVKDAVLAIALSAAEPGFLSTVARGVFAGWLIALLVWLLPASARESKVAVVFLFTYIIGLGDFSHVVAGSAEVLFAVAQGAVSWGDYLGGFLVPALIGNVIGGVLLVTILNHEQVVAGTRDR